MLDQRHSNKVGEGRPYHRQIVDAPVHEHTWSNDGYGYVEPLDSSLDTLIKLFEHFCAETNLKVEGRFKPPPSQQFTLGF